MIINYTKSVQYMFYAALLIMGTFNLVACTSPEEKAYEFYQSGMRLFNVGDFDKADVEFRNALQINKSMVKAIWGRMLVAEKKRNLRNVVKLLNSILAINPDHFESIVKKGRLYLLAGKLDKALEMSAKAIEVNNSDPTALTLHAAVMLKIDSKEEAVYFANKALGIDPEYVDAFTVLASEKIIANKFDSAIQYANKGLNYDSKNITLQHIKIHALEKLKKYDFAEEVYKQLMLDYPDLLLFGYSLSNFYLVNNRKGDAEIVLRDIVKNNSNNNEAKMKLIRFLESNKGYDEAKRQLETYVNAGSDNKLKLSLLKFYIKNNDYELAYKLADKIILNIEDKKVALNAKGIKALLHYKEGDIDNAEATINNMLDEDSGNETALILKAILEIQRHEYEMAISTLRLVLRNNPGSSKALYNIARAYHLSGSIELADEQYFNAFKASKYSAFYGIRYANFLLQRNLIIKAEKILMRIIEVSPRNVSAMELLANVHLMRGDWIGAQQVADNIKQVSNNDGLVKQIKGAIHAGKGDFEQSIALLQDAYHVMPNKVQPAVALINTYIRAGKQAEARKFINALLKINPNDINLRTLSGQLYFSQGDVEKAINSYKQVIVKNPINSTGHYLLATTYIQQNDYTKANKIISDGLSHLPNDYILLMVKANLLQLSKEYSDAISIYEKIIKQNPELDIVANNLASLILETRKDKISFRKAYNYSLRFKYTVIPQFRDTFGWASYHIGNYLDADIALNFAVTKLPHSPDVHYHLGMNYLAQKKNKLARKELEKALELVRDKPFSKLDVIHAALSKL